MFAAYEDINFPIFFANTPTTGVAIDTADIALAMYS